MAIGDFSFYSFDMGFGDPVTAFNTPHTNTNNQQITPCRIMKIFTFLASIAAFAEALTPAQQNAAEREFRKFDHDHNGKIASGAVYGALSELDKKLTEAQLQKAAGHNKVFF